MKPEAGNLKGAPGPFLAARLDMPMRDATHRAVRNWFPAWFLVVASCGGVVARSASEGGGGSGGSSANTGAGGSVAGSTGSGGDSTGGAGPTGGGPVTSGCSLGQSTPCTCSSGATGLQFCQSDGTFGPCSCAPTNDGNWEQQMLARIRAGVVGTWSGTQTNPWQPSCSVVIRFDADGHYAAHSSMDDSCIVFYYGTNDDSPQKTYLLDDVTAAGEGSGQLAIYFAPNDLNEAQLSHIALSDDGMSLTFECMKDNYGPLQFVLTRATP